MALAVNYLRRDSYEIRPNLGSLPRVLSAASFGEAISPFPVLASLRCHCKARSVLSHRQVAYRDNELLSRTSSEHGGGVGSDIELPVSSNMRSPDKSNECIAVSLGLFIVV